MTNVIDSVKNFDVKTYTWCMTRKNAPSIAQVSRWVSKLGDGGPYAVLGLLLAMLEPSYGLTVLMVGVCAYLIELPVYWVLKNSIKRDRPHIQQGFRAFIVPSDKFSFPSGHTAAAFVMATTLSFFYPTFALAYYALALLIGTSRVLLGVHYPTDIIAGMVLGLTSATIALSLVG